MFLENPRRVVDEEARFVESRQDTRESREDRRKAPGCCLNSERRYDGIPSCRPYILLGVRYLLQGPVQRVHRPVSLVGSAIIDGRVSATLCGRQVNRERGGGEYVLEVDGLHPCWYSQNELDVFASRLCVRHKQAAPLLMSRNPALMTAAVWSRHLVKALL